MELVSWNVVLTAQRFNPSILNQIWLANHKIVNADDFEPECVFSEVATVVQTKEFSLTVVPDLLQLTPKAGIPPERESALVSETIQRIVGALPETPYTAIGLNFVWHYVPIVETISELTRRLFFKADEPLYSYFDVQDAGFGGYMSKPFHSMRLKLDIKPIVSVRGSGVREHALQFAFNYHRDLEPAKALELIKQVVDEWDNAKREGERLTRETVGKGEFIDASN